MNHPIQVVILAGGLGTRLHPITEKIPKALIPIRGEPFISHQLKWLSRQGIQDIILSIGYLGNLIQDYVREGSDWNLKVRYVLEGPVLRGTGGALRWVYEQGILNEQFLVTYGDSLLPIDFRKVWEAFLQSEELALMTVLHNEGKWDQSNAAFADGRIPLYFKGKPVPPALSNYQLDFIDYGLSAFSKRVVEAEIPSETKYDLADVFHRLSLARQLAGYEVKQRFYEIGSYSGIQDLENDLDQIFQLKLEPENAFSGLKL